MAAVDLSDAGVCKDDVYSAEGDDDVDDCVDTENAVSCGLCDGETSDPDSHAFEVSVVGPPLFTDDDRRSGPAEQDHQSQGGPVKSKHQDYKNIDDEFTPEVIDRARANYARFSGIPLETVTTDFIIERAPSLGIGG